MPLSYSTYIKLGSNQDLSKLELSTLLENFSITELNFMEWKDYIFLKLDKEIENKIFQDFKTTGSIIKAGHLDAEIIGESIEESVLTNIIDKKIEQLSGKNRPIKFAINIVTNSNTRRHEISNSIRKSIESKVKKDKILLKILPTKRDSLELSPFQYHKENLSKRGVELICFDFSEKLFFGYTSWVTNPIVDIKQDEERPARLFTHGTSIKLSRTLVNLAKLKANDTLLDPFCGTGTILLEALRNGIKAIGVDKDPKCVRASKENLNHFTLKFPSKAQMKEKWKVYNKDSRFIDKIILEEIDGIVSEPYLGPLLKELPSRNKAENIIRELENLYSTILKGAAVKLRRGSYVIFIMPEYFYSENLRITPNHLNIGNQTSLKVISKSTFFNVNLPINIGREHNIINRKLVIFQKQ